MTLGKTKKIALMSISGQFIIRTRFGKLKLTKPAKARFLLTHGKLVHVKAKKHRFKIRKKAIMKHRFGRNVGRGMSPGLYCYDDIPQFFDLSKLPIILHSRYIDTISISRGIGRSKFDRFINRCSEKNAGFKHHFKSPAVKKSRFTK